ncbi:MAG: ribosome silencing factor [Magnetococcales bacterium]|nr:ribosome silencing factor [Magnetococcales bacterium]
MAITAENSALANELVQRLNDKKALDVVLIDLAGRSAFADFFIIATGTSTTHVASLSSEVDLVAHEHKVRVRGIEGLMECSWVLLDLGDILVHLFRQEAREFYNLEKLWSPQTRPPREEKVPQVEE